MVMDIKFTATNPAAGMQQAQQSPMPGNKEETATEFERLFALHLVKEMTDGLFEHEGNSIVGNSGNFYRDFITGTLADELAEERRLGMADLIIKHWDREGLFQQTQMEQENGTAG
jgi:Rod binding domain-containing protein